MRAVDHDQSYTTLRAIMWSFVLSLGLHFKPFMCVASGIWSVLKFPFIFLLSQLVLDTLLILFAPIWGPVHSVGWFFLVTSRGVYPPGVGNRPFKELTIFL